MTATCAESEKDADDSPEGDQNSEGVDDAMTAEAAAFFAGGLQKGEAFEEENREDAGHQIEDDAADEGQGR